MVPNGLKDCREKENDGDKNWQARQYRDHYRCKEETRWKANSCNNYNYPANSWKENHNEA